MHFPNSEDENQSSYIPVDTNLKILNYTELIAVTNIRKSHAEIKGVHISYIHPPTEVVSDPKRSSINNRHSWTSFVPFTWFSVYVFLFILHFNSLSYELHILISYYCFFFICKHPFLFNFTSLNASTDMHIFRLFHSAYLFL